MERLFKSSNISKVIIFMFLFMSVALTNNAFADTLTSKTISKIDDIYGVLIKGQTYELPSTLTAVMSDGSTEQVEVIWEASRSNTSKADKYIFYGTVQGYSTKVVATIYKKYIQSIAGISAAVNQGDQYTLPSTVTAILNDGSTAQVAVTWSPSNVDTSNLGIFTFQGTVQGYSNKVTLTLNVVPRNVELEKGNTSGNIASGALVAQKNEWIYYSNRSWNGALFKMKTDGTGITKLTDDSCLYINVVGDWIYYENSSDSSNLYKIKTDGTERTKLNDDGAQFINVVGDWIYYENLTGGFLYKIKTDGTGRTKLSDDCCLYINVIGDWIYYQNASDSYTLYKIKIDGTEKTKVGNDYSTYINIVGDWIYYQNVSDGYRLYKVKIDGTERTKLTDDYSNYINVVGDWIYYGNAFDNSIYKIKTDGTGRTKLTDDHYSWYINVVGDWIYFGNSSFMYKIKTDGTGEQMLH